MYARNVNSREKGPKGCAAKIHKIYGFLLEPFGNYRLDTTIAILLYTSLPDA